MATKGKVGNPEGRTREMRKQRAGKTPMCGAKLRRSEETCTMPAGWGTDHPGVGFCKHHLGNFKDQIVKAAIPNAEKILGKPLDISPHEALIATVQYCASDVAWLNYLMEQVDEEDPVTKGIFGDSMDILFKERQNALFLLARVSKMALDAGIAERQVRLAENVGSMIATALNGILAGLELTDEQLLRVPALIRTNIASIEGMKPEGVLDAEPIADGPTGGKRPRARAKRKSGSKK